MVQEHPKVEQRHKSQIQLAATVPNKDSLLQQDCPLQFTKAL